MAKARRFSSWQRAIQSFLRLDPVEKTASSFCIPQPHHHAHAEHYDHHDVIYPLKHGQWAGLSGFKKIGPRAYWREILARRGRRVEQKKFDIVLAECPSADGRGRATLNFPGAMASRVGFRTWLFPAAQAFLTGSATLLGVVLVLLWRPNRVRQIPFYSDSSHHDPERVLLACGENLACFFMPLVALLEYMHQSRLLAETNSVRPSPPRQLRWMLRSGATTSGVIQLNFLFTLMTTAFFFVTANVPSKRPFTPPHQLAASGLILTYSLQSVLKAVLANTFDNYRCDGASGPDEICKASGILSATLRLWERHHMKLRMCLVYVLWLSLLGTWLTFVGRKIVSWLALSNATAKREFLSSSMAVIVYAATTACVILMVIMAIDMRADRVILYSRTAGAIGYNRAIATERNDAVPEGI